MNNKELVDILKVQGSRIDILVKKLKKLESKNILLEDLIDRVAELEERMEEKDGEISHVHRIIESI